MQYGCIRDPHIDYLMKRVWVPAAALVQGQVTGASTLLTADAAGVLGTLEQLGTSGHSAIKLAATTTNVDYRWRVPYDFDKWNRLYIRVKWTSNYATANGTATWRALYKTIKNGDAIAAGDTALSKTIPVSTKVSATARTEYWTPYGYLAPSIQFDDDLEEIAIRLNVNAVAGITIASDFVWLVGFELGYTPRQTFGDGNRRRARIMLTNLGFQEVDAANEP